MAEDRRLRGIPQVPAPLTGIRQYTNYISEQTGGFDFNNGVITTEILVRIAQKLRRPASHGYIYAISDIEVKFNGGEWTTIDAGGAIDLSIPNDLFMVNTLSLKPPAGAANSTFRLFLF